jgi:flagellar biosynthesis/type III secretory pathway protein FliH
VWCLVVAAVSAAACGAKARAQTVPDSPPLAIPAPPSRVFAPVEDEEPLVSSPVAPETPPAQPPRLSNPRPPARRPQPAEERAEQAPAPTPAPQPSAETPRELRAASSPADADAERKIADLTRRATQTLNNIYYQGLSTARRETYDQAKAFLREAEQAMKERNFVYAETLADKAAKLASELVGR